MTILVSKHSFVRYKEISSAMLLSSSTIKNFLFCYHEYSPFCYFLNSTMVTPASPSPNSPRRKDCDMLLAFQVIVYTFSKCTGTLTVNDSYCFEMCDICIIQIFVQLCNRLVNGFAEKVDLGGDACRFGHADLSGSGLRGKQKV